MSAPEYTIPRLLHCIDQIRQAAISLHKPDMWIVRWAEAALNESRGPGEGLMDVCLVKDASVDPFEPYDALTLTQRQQFDGTHTPDGTREWNPESGWNWRNEAAPNALAVA